MVHQRSVFNKIQNHQLSDTGKRQNPDRENGSSKKNKKAQVEKDESTTSKQRTRRELGNAYCFISSLSLNSLRL